MTAGDIWVYADLRTERHWQACRRILVKAQSLADDADAKINILMLGTSAAETVDTCADMDLSACVALEEAAKQAAELGIDKVVCLTHADLRVPRCDLYASVMAEFFSKQRPWLVLMPLNDFGRETAAICAQRCQAGLIADSTAMRFENGQFIGRCPAWGGQILAHITMADGWPTAFVTVQPHGVGLPEAQSTQAPVERIELDRIEPPSGMRLIKRAVEAGGESRLEDAETVVVGGAGMGDMRGFAQVRELAATLGGEVGATRPPVLYHWVEEARLIGQTGKSVRPKLLISAGASGAIQYTAGIMEAETIVAINRDAAAPIFHIADIGLVADANAVLPLLNQHAQQAAMKRLADASCAVSADASAADAQEGFGSMVRRLREAREWRQEDLAHATGQNPEFIDQVESGQLSPPVGFILRMAQAMKIDAATFLNRETQAAIRDRRAQAYYQRTQAYSYTTLTPEAASSHLRAFMITIEAHHDHKPVAYKHEGEEFIYVMEGDLGLTLDAKQHVLKPGESIHFNSDVPHKLKSLSSRPTRCLVVLYTV